MIELGAAREDLERRLAAERGWRIARWTELDAGRNNRLFRLDRDGGPPLLGKFYGSNPWGGLRREFATLAFLGARRFPGVPRAHLRSDAFTYAVYSFEPGVAVAPADFTDAALVAAAAFAADLHAFGPEPGASALPPTIEFCGSPADQRGIIARRLGGFLAFATGPTAPAEVRALCRAIDLRAEVDRLIARASADLAPADLARALPREAWRLNTADFGPHNILVRPDGLTVVDFEWAGWDDPARLVMGFVSHPASAGLTPAGRATFLRAYARARALAPDEVARFERVGALYDVEWVAACASAMTAEAVAIAEFAVAGFDARAHRAGLIARLEARLERARSGIGYRFPDEAG